mgnify:CR=1 FL=1
MEQEDRKNKYDKWVNKVCQYIEEYGARINSASCAFQSKPVLDKSPSVIFLGYNAHEEDFFYGANKERFYSGNPSFYKDRYTNEWKIWNKLYEAFKWAQYLPPVTDGNFVFMNIIYFGSHDIRQFKALPNSDMYIDACVNYTAEVIHEVFNPKCIVCFSIPDCFNLLNNKFQFSHIEDVTPAILDGGLARHNIRCGMWNGIPIYGIPHPSGRISNDDWGAIAMWLKTEMCRLGI